MGEHGGFYRHAGSGGAHRRTYGAGVVDLSSNHTGDADLSLL